MIYIPILEFVAISDIDFRSSNLINLIHSGSSIQFQNSLWPTSQKVYPISPELFEMSKPFCSDEWQQIRWTSCKVLTSLFPNAFYGLFFFFLPDGYAR